MREEKFLNKKRKNVNIQIKFNKQIELASKDFLLDLDLLHSCVSPPTELNESTESKYILTNRKAKEKKQYCYKQERKMPFLWKIFKKRIPPVSKCSL
jgi:hypothetical protein